MVGVLPDTGAAYIAFANGGAGSMPFHRDLAEAILEKRFGLPPQDSPDVSGPAPDPSRYHGVYRELGRGDHGHRRRRCPVLPAEVHRTDLHAGLADARPAPVAARRRTALVLADYPDQPPFAYGIGDDGTGHPRFLFAMDQFVRRIDDI